MNNNKFDKTNLSIGNLIGGDQNHISGDQINVEGDHKTTTNIKNTGIIGLLGTIILISILVIMTFYFLGIDKKDIEKAFGSEATLSDRQKILESIRGTYLDEQNNELIFSPKAVSGMDGSVSIQGQVVSYYKLISENSIYIGAQFNRDGFIGIPFTLNGSQLELFTGEGDETRILTKISNSY